MKTEMKEAYSSDGFDIVIGHIKRTITEEFIPRPRSEIEKFYADLAKFMDWDYGETVGLGLMRAEEEMQKEIDACAK